MNKVKSVIQPEEDYYYAINVEAQMATKDGTVDNNGHKDNYERFGDPAHGGWTGNGQALVKKIAGDDIRKVTIVSNGITFEPHENWRSSRTFMEGLGHMYFDGETLKSKLEEISKQLPEIQYSNDFQIILDGSYASILGYSLYDDNFENIYNGDKLLLPDEPAMYIALFEVVFFESNEADWENGDYTIYEYAFKITR
jgi:hypothetical protein